MMADKSAIEWTDATWNPTVGCSIVSPGCTNCYAMKVANGLERRFDSSKYRGLTKVVNGNAVWTGEVRLDEAALLQPFKWKRGRRIFVNSMSDLFHEALSDADIDRVFAVMALCPQHTFQVLTKRAERMRAYLSMARAHPVGMEAFGLVLDEHARKAKSNLGTGVILQGDIAHLQKWPLPNVWLGVSAERQKEADERIPRLLHTPAAIRFVSAEPLLAPIDFMMLVSGDSAFDALQGAHAWRDGDSWEHAGTCAKLDWIIVGGESGQGAREHDIAWSREIIAQCKAAGVSVFEKQLGSAPYSEPDRISYKGRKARVPHPGFWRYLNDRKGGDWSEWPEDLRVREFPLVGDRADCPPGLLSPEPKDPEANA